MSASTGEPLVTNGDRSGSRSALSVRSLSKTFPGVRALRGVDLDVASGSVHAVLGHNGCGKSTLVKALAGVHAPDPGARAWIDGQPLQIGHPDDAERKGLRFVHQELGLISELGAMDNVGFIVGYERARMGHIQWRRQARMTSDLLARFGFDLDPRRPLGEATPSERTAVAIVRAVAGWRKGSGVLVLDEPTASLPAREVDELFRLIREVRDSGTAVILVSHRLDEVMSIADHATVMRDGEVVWNGAVAGMHAGDFVEMIANTQGDARAAMVEARSERLPRRDAAVALTATDVAGQYLRGVTLSVHAGEIVGVAGLLGSGREELPYILAGAQRLETGGTVTVGDATFAEITVERAQSLGLVLVPADRAREGIFADFTTGENVSLASLPAISSGGALRPSSEHRFSRHWLAAVGADPGVVDRKITTLSGGNQQKAVLARWLSTEPTVLMLSEPTAGVDAGARRVIYAELRARADQGLAILMSSSDVEDLLAVCDRVIVLRDGSITAELVGAEATKAAIVAAMEGVHGEQG